MSTMDIVDSLVVSYTIKGRFAIVALNNPGKLNALNSRQYYRLASLMDEIDSIPEVLFTILTGTGRFFSAGADISSRPLQTDTDTRHHYLQTFLANNLYLTDAFSTHSKIFVAALNGLAVGGSAAAAAFVDFIYAAPHTYLLTPFASLGLVSEIGTSHTLPQRLGVSLANEVMIMGRKITAQQLLRCGFVNKIFDVEAGEHSLFLSLVLEELEDRLCGHLNSQSLLKIKALIRRPEVDRAARQNVAEVFAGLERLSSGAVNREMEKLSSGEKRHRL